MFTQLCELISGDQDMSVLCCFPTCLFQRCHLVIPGEDCQIVDRYLFCDCLTPQTSQLYGEGWLGL